MRGISGQYGLEVLADGVDLGLDASNVVSMHIINNIHQFLPSFKVGFKDDTGRALDNLLIDGAKLQVSLGVPDVFMYPGKPFAVLGMPNVQPGTAFNGIESSAVYDAIGWSRKIVDRHFPNMTSADVISQLASMAGLTAEVDATVDLMTWLPNQSTIAQYAQHVTDRAFKQAGSALLTAVTDNGIVKFKDLNTLISTSPTKTFASNPDQGDLKVLSYAASPKSQITNAAYGYGSTSVSMNEDGSIFEGNKIEMTLMSAISGASQRFKDAIGDLGSRVSVLSPLAGNTHKHWNEALHQNVRTRSAYAFDIEMIIDRPAQVDLLDMIRFVPTNMANQNEARQLVGNYIVTATTKFLYKSRYLEKIVATSQSAGGV